MTRRSALAAAFLLTATFSFFVIAYGSSAGLFAWSESTDSEAAPDVASEPTSDPRRPAGVVTASPRIVTEYVYVDEVATQQAQAAEYEADDERYEHEDDEDEHDGDEHDEHERYEHEDHEEHEDDD